MGEKNLLNVWFVVWMFRSFPKFDLDFHFLLIFLNFWYKFSVQILLILDHGSNFFKLLI